MSSDFSLIIEEVKKVISGKDNVLWLVLTTMLARGHILLEDIPGVGKTTMAVAFSKALGLSCGRVQFTPDVMPSDITGYSMYDKATGKMSYQPGAVLCNLFLADELNRATSRTQSALLEAMEEGQVTVDGTSHKVPEPFMVIATQNPTGAAGTQLLPDSQIDRFAVKMTIGYPSVNAERAMLASRQKGVTMNSVRQVVTQADFMRMQKEAGEVYMSQQIVDYIVDLISATRSHALLERGASPRTTVSLAEMAKAIAYVQERDYVVPADVRRIFADTVAHRIIPSREAVTRGVSARSITDDVIATVAAPGEIKRSAAAGAQRPAAQRPSAPRPSASDK